MLRSQKSGASAVERDRRLCHRVSPCVLAGTHVEPNFPPLPRSVMLLQRFHLVLASAAAAIVLLGFLAGVSVWHLQAASHAATVDAHSMPSLTLGVWIIGAVTVLGCVSLVGVGMLLTRSFRTSLETLWTTIDRLQTGAAASDEEIAPDDELLRAARALQRTSRALRETTVSKSYLHAILDSMAEVLFVTDAEGRIRHVNRAGTERLNRPAESVAGAALQDVFDESPLRDGVGTTVERTLPDAAEATGVPVLVSSAELQRPTSDELEVVVVAQDISALKRTEAALKQSVREKEVLLREVHHRVKNNLQIVCSLLHAEETAVSDPVVRQRFSSLQNRIRSMAAIHEQLYEAEDLSRVPFASYLRDLAPHLVRAHGAPPTCLRVDAEPLSLPVSTALPLGLVVTELVGNAFTHAFPEGEPGVVTIELRRRGEDAVLTVSDEGVGAQGWPDGRPDPSSPPPEADAPAPATGLGLRLVRGFVRQIRGCVEIDVDAGTHVRVTFPPPAPAGSPPSEATP